MLVGNPETQENDMLSADLLLGALIVLVVGWCVAILIELSINA